MSRTKLNFYLNNQLVGNANNWPGISMSLDFNNDGAGPFTVQPAIQTDSLEFVLTENNIIRDYIQNGVNGGGPGIYEPMELRIELASSGNAIDVFEGLLDMVNDMQFIDKNKVLVKLVKKSSTERLNERTQAISFAFLESKGEITNADYEDVKYVLAHIPDFREVIMIAITIFLLIKEIAEQVKRVIDLVGELAALTASGLTGFVGALILLLVKTVTEIVYTFIIILALKELMIQLIGNLVAPLRTHKGMKLRTLLEKGATHLGYTFKSSEFNDPFFDSLTILPIKEKAPLPIGEKGFPTNKGGLYLYFEMLQFYKQLINGKIVVRGTEIIIERRDFFDTQTSFVLPDIKLLESRFNAEEIQANLNIQFLLDEKDDTTLINYVVNNTTFQKTTEPKIVVEKRNVQIKGLEQQNLPVSLPTRKESLTVVEAILLEVAQLVDIYGGGNFFTSQITGRLGVLHLANDFTGVPKIVPIALGKVRPDYRTLMSAKVLHDKYYFINSFTPDPINHNQYRRHQGVLIPFCFEDYVTLSENPGFTTVDGREGKFEKIEGNPNSGSAKVDIRIKEVFTNNLKDTII